LNVDSDGDDVTSGGKLFHVRVAGTWNARSPTVERLVVVSNSAGVDADRRRRRESTAATRWKPSARYNGARRGDNDRQVQQV